MLKPIRRSEFQILSQSDSNFSVEKSPALYLWIPLEPSISCPFVSSRMASSAAVAQLGLTAAPEVGSWGADDRSPRMGWLRWFKLVTGHVLVMSCYIIYYKVLINVAVIRFWEHPNFDLYPCKSCPQSLCGTVLLYHYILLWCCHFPCSYFWLETAITWDIKRHDL
jgi:hypothetical protein